jgi:hypothetical protein
MSSPSTTAPRNQPFAALRSKLAGRDIGPAVILLVFLLLLPLSTPRVALSDEVQYYAYLRSFYFDHDLDFRNEYEHFATVGQQFGDPAVFNALLRTDAANPNPTTGLLRNVAPIGSAILWSPGFVLADLGVQIANLFGANIPRDGYGRPYIVAVCMMSALYCLLGLLLTYRLARRFAGSFAATLATLTVFLSSSLVFYTFIAMPWSHANGFFLFALFLWLWWGNKDTRAQGHKGTRAHNESPLEPLSKTNGLDVIVHQTTLPVQTWLLLGLVGGLMVMTREQLGLLLIMPAAAGLLAYAQFIRTRAWGAFWQLLLRHGLFLATLVVTVVPQLLAYKTLNGRYGPSSTVAGKLDWRSPRFFDTLLDPAHGALLWAPVLAFGLLGLFWLARKNALLAALLLLGFAAQTYINGAFGTTWHLSGAFGFRRLIECTPIFVLGLACLLEWAKPRLGPWPLLVCALLLIYWNLGLIAQWTVIRKAEGFRLGLIWDGMLYYQFVEVPGQVITRLYDLLFDRCKFVTNC